jgi:hypothetical protein
MTEDRFFKFAAVLGVAVIVLQIVVLVFNVIVSIIH